MCQVSHPKRRAVASMPAPAEEPPDGDDDKTTATLTTTMTTTMAMMMTMWREMCLNMKACRMSDPCIFANDLVIDIVQIAAGDRGCRCREHKVCCGKVVDVGIVVCLRHKKILVPYGKDNMREETTIPANWVTNRCKHCHVGFLPLPYVPNAAVYDGALCQVIEVFDKDDLSRANQARLKKPNGFVHMMVISKLNG